MNYFILSSRVTPFVTSNLDFIQVDRWWHKCKKKSCFSSNVLLVVFTFCCLKTLAIFHTVWSISVLHSSTLRWWNCADPPTHTWNTWTSSVCSPVWACGCLYECLAPCCSSGGSYSRLISSGQSMAWQTNILPSIVTLHKKSQRY